LLVEGFRAFSRLHVERFGRVNLIVGRNNSGKSTLLEAIRLWASRGSPRVIQDILIGHDELKATTRSDDDFGAVASLFYGRDKHAVLDRRIWIESNTRLGSGPHFDIRPVYRRSNGEILLTPYSHTEGLLADVTPSLTIAFADRQTVISVEALTDPRLAHRTLRDDDAIPVVLVPPDALSSPQLGVLWDVIALTDLEEQVAAAVRIIAPDVQRLSFVGDSAARVPVVKLQSTKRPVPLLSLGDGVKRMLGIMLSLANARNGILLLDEVENGIHYSVQPKVWELICATAKRLDVQVFATTHSWDCIQAFQEAAAREDAALIRLDAVHDGDVRATIFGANELSVVAREQIEVR
jgi:energy-coupling factor transporter ATP-binding protein EcfA2